MGVKQVLVATMIVLIAVIIVKVYPNYPSGRLGVLFYYCCRSHDDRTELKATREGLASLPFSSDTQLTILIHGYTESSFRTWVLNLTNALLTREPGSVVILVDYWDLVTISRPYMMVNARMIADHTAQLIDLLVLEKSIKLDKIHLIGFSLGGRISGLVGDRVKTGRLGRITGIDASYPWLPPKTNAEFLDASDAKLVVNLRTSPVGSHSPPGHIDFHANGGLSQPGCNDWYLPETARQVCSHYRAVVLMEEAVRLGNVFPACKCDSWETFSNHSCSCEIVSYFGLTPNTSAHGKFYFSTNSAPPYSRLLDQKK